jgi:hypothetical protein
MLDRIEEAKFAEMRAMCRELKVPSAPEIMIGLKVHDRSGEQIFQDVQRGHSWLRNYWNCLFRTAARAGNVGSTYAAGSLATKNKYTSVGDLGVMDWKTIKVGTNDTAWSLSNYILGALIASGNGSGQLLASSFVTDTPTYDSQSKTWSVNHHTLFNNNSGAEITVKETGLFDPNGYEVWAERTVLNPAVAVPNAAQLTVTYAISMDFSAID